MLLRTHKIFLASFLGLGSVSSASAQFQDVDWRAYGRASSLSVAQALPRTDEECKEIESIEARIAEGMSGWRLPAVDPRFFIGLYEGYVDELRLGRQECGLGERLPGRSVGRVAASIASAMWEGTLRDAKPAAAQSALREFGEAVDFQLSDSEQVACGKALSQYFFQLSTPSRIAIEKGEMEFAELLTFMIIPAELSKPVCESSAGA